MRVMVSARSLGGVLGAAALACAPEAPQFPDAVGEGTSTSVASDDAGSMAATDAATSSGSSSDDGIVDGTAQGTAPESDTSGTTGASLETTAASDDTTSTTDTGPSPGEPFGPCPGGDTDCPRGAICIEVTQEGNVLATVCGEPCTRDDVCASSGMGEMPVCFPLVMGAACALSCEEGMLCPPGMECAETGAGSLCVWPSGM